MRLEFIAWDKEKKSWVDQNEIAIDGNGKVYYITGSASFTEQYLSEPEKINQIDIYQYIGRKDKDGNKVYEGSLIDNSLGGSVNVIAYNERTCSFQLKDVYGNAYSIDCNPELFDLCKVIGHIAEEAPNEPNNTSP